MPSWPSPLTRCRAMVSAVRSATSARGPAGDLRDQRLRGGDGTRRGRQELTDVSVDSRVEIALGTDGVSQSDLTRSGCSKPRPREEQLTRRRCADLGDGEGGDHRGKNAQLGFGKTELRGLACHDDVADGGEAGASAEGSAMDAADQAEPEACRAPGTSPPWLSRRERSRRGSSRPSSTSRSGRRRRRSGCPRRGERRRARLAASGPWPTPSAPRSTPR